VANDRYPLHAAERLRNAQRGQAERELADAQARWAEACAAIETAERALHVHAGRTPGAKPVAQVITALELQREAAFAQRHADEARRLQECCGAARQRLVACETALRQAQDRLGLARASEHAIERNHARFDAAQRREHEQVEQVEVEEGLVRSRKERGR
jgi:hypothetical protein